MLVSVLLSMSKRPYGDTGSRLFISRNKSRFSSLSMPSMSSTASVKFFLLLLTSCNLNKNCLNKRRNIKVCKRNPIIEIINGINVSWFAPIINPIARKLATTQRIWLKLFLKFKADLILNLYLPYG